MVTGRRVYVTGLAWTTALGNDLADVWRRLQCGDSAFVKVAHPWRLRNNLAAVLPEPAAGLAAGLRLRRLAAETARRALQDAGRQSGDAGVGFVIGTSLGSWLDDAADLAAPLDCWARDVAADLRLSADAILVSTACSAGSDSVAIAAELVRSGRMDACLCGGADILTDTKRLAHSALSTLSPTMLRAFDRRHDGTLLGEGAAFLFLEATPGRRPYAVARGLGAGNDANGMTAPSSNARGAVLALRRSLRDAGIASREIGIINAHGSGTPLNDATERDAFRIVFGEAADAVVFATKGNFGHTLGATGAIEAVATIMTLRNGQVPPIAHLEDPDPEFPLRLSTGQTTTCATDFGMSLTLGFGGFDSSLIFEVPS